MSTLLARGAGLALALVLSAACNAETDTPRAPGQVAGDKPGQAIAVSCESDGNIAAEPRAEIEAHARTLHKALREGQLDVLWDDLHPQARRDDQRKPFMGALAAMQLRLQDQDDEPEIDRVLRVDVSGGVNSLAQVQCGEPNADDAVHLVINAGDEDVAVVILRSGAATSFATTIQLRRRGERWRLLGIQVNPSHYRGKSAAAYEIAADVYMRQQKVVAAFFLLGVAQTLSDRGASVESSLHLRIEEKLAGIEQDQLFAAETGTWTLGDDRFDIEGLSLVSNHKDISPVIKYLSPQGLVRDLLDRDADKLIAEIKRRFPELQRHFDAVVFEAYADVPNEPGKSYQAYRVVRYFDPAKRHG